MKSKESKIAIAISYIDEDLIAAAEAPFKSRKRPIIKFTVIAACLSLAIAIPLCCSAAINLFKANDFQKENDSKNKTPISYVKWDKQPYDTTEINKFLPDDIDNIIWGNGSGFVPGIEIPRFNGWNIDFFIYSKLKEENQSQYIAIRVCKPNLDYFVYNGNSTTTVINEQLAKKGFRVKLKRILNNGDKLKYGELIYTDGTPEGDKWTKEFYDNEITFYGESFLSQYIVDGQFLLSKAEEDLKKCEEDLAKLNKLYDEIVECYENRYLEYTKEEFIKANVDAVIRNDRLFIFVTKEQLADLEVANKENYYLTLANRRNYEHIKGNIPTYLYGITDFATEKINFSLRNGNSGYVGTDKDVVDNLNLLIEQIQFNTDKIYICVYADDKVLTEELFNDIKYEYISISRHTSSALMTVKFENINLEALKNISQLDYIESIDFWGYQ